MEYYSNDDKGFETQKKLIDDFQGMCDFVVDEDGEQYYQEDDENGDPVYDWDWVKEDVGFAIGFLEENCKFNDPNEKIKIARCINLEDIKDFNKDNMGNSWTTLKEFYAFASGNLPKKNLYCITGVTAAKNVDWVESVQLYVYNDYEYELRVINDTPEMIKDVRLWKVVDGKIRELDLQEKIEESIAFEKIFKESN